MPKPTRKIWIGKIRNALSKPVRLPMKARRSISLVREGNVLSAELFSIQRSLKDSFTKTGSGKEKLPRVIRQRLMLLSKTLESRGFIVDAKKLELRATQSSELLLKARSLDKEWKAILKREEKWIPPEQREKEKARKSELRDELEVITRELRTRDYLKERILPERKARSRRVFP